jgi:hypothetical protein
VGLADVARILTDPELYGIIKSLDPAAPSSEKLVQRIVKVASYTRDLNSTVLVAKFLHARRHSEVLEAVGTLIENTVFMARDRKSVREIIAGFGAGSVDRVLQRHADHSGVLSNIRDVAWKMRDSASIRAYLESL